MHFLSFKGIMRKQIKQPGYQCLFLFLYSTEMKLLQLIQTTTDLRWCWCSETVIFLLNWFGCSLNVFCSPELVLLTSPVLMQLVQTRPRVLGGPELWKRVWRYRFCLASLHTKQISWFWGVTGQIFHWSSEMVSTQKKKSGREPCVAPAQRQPRSGTQTDVTH